MSGARPDTWMPFYIGDYLADTMHLTRDQHGAYLLLIMAYWRNSGALLDDDTALAAVTRCGPAEWRKLRRVMEPFFQIEGGRWHHKRIDKELQNAAESYSKRKARSDAANAAKEAARATNKDTDKDTDKVALLETQPQPQSSYEERAAPAGARPRDPAERIYAEIGHGCEAVILNTGRVGTWLRDGFDLDLDILPAIRKALKSKRKTEPEFVPRGLDYFDGAIADARATRLKPMPEGAANGSGNRSNPAAASARATAIAGIAAASRGPR